MIRPVQGHIGRKIPRHRRLTVGDQSNERIFAHRLHRRVRAALLADGGGQLGGEVLAAGRSCAVGRHHGHLIGQGQQRLVDCAVHRPSQVGAGAVAEVCKVGATDIADEQRIPGQHSGRRGI